MPRPFGHYLRPDRPILHYEIKMKNEDFGKALEELRAGRRVWRNGWNGKGMHLELQRPDEHSKMTLPYIYINTACGNVVPWLASQTDILAQDWFSDRVY